VAEDMLFPLGLKNTAKKPVATDASGGTLSWHDPMDQGGQRTHKDKYPDQPSRQHMQGLELLHILLQPMATPQAEKGPGHRLDAAQE